MSTIQLIAIVGVAQLILVQGIPLKSLSLTCSQHRQAVVNQSVIGQILYDTYYIPECTENGKEWQRAQCSRMEKGVCFCVEPTSGKIIKETVTTAASRQDLQCSEDTTRAISDLGMCPRALAKLRSFVKENPNVTDSPFGYSPDCQNNGQFYAMQRNENHFFCVDVDTGDVIPDTITSPIVRRAISEKLCQEYSRLWKEFIDLYPDNKPHQSPFEVADENSCQNGFVYQSCGCLQSCNPHGNEVAHSCEICKPACVCPNGFLEYNGTCVTTLQCRSMKTQQTSASRHNPSWKNFVSIYGSELLHGSLQVEEENVDPNLQRPFIEEEESLMPEEEEESFEPEEEVDHGEPPVIEEYEETGGPELEVDYHEQSNITEPELPYEEPNLPIEEPAGEDTDEEFEEIGEPELEIDFHGPSFITDPQLPFEESNQPTEEPEEEDTDEDYLFPPEQEDPHFYPYHFELDTGIDETRPLEIESVAEEPVTPSPTKKSSEISKSQIQLGLNTGKLIEEKPLTETKEALLDKKKFSAFLETWHRR